MSKYIIKNCDCYGFGDACLSNNANRLYCKDITDCVLKRIVNECRNELEKRNAYFVSIHYDFAREILKFVEIEECE